MKAITIRIDAEPVAHGRAGVYDPVKSRKWKELVRTAAIDRALESRWKISDAPIRIRIAVYIAIPKSWNGAKRERAQQGLILPTSRPDATNYAKGIEDALNGVVYKDDSQIVEIVVSKGYSTRPGVAIYAEEALA